MYVSNSEDEKKAVDLILCTLVKYMLDCNINVDFLSEMKLQKIVFKTVEELDLPITRSWYIRGCMVHPGGTLSGKIRKENLEKLVINPEKLTINTDIYSCFDSIQIDKIFFTKRNKFLRELYNSMEPIRFRKEYIPNNELILSLEALSGGVYDEDSTAISENISKLYLGMQGDKLFDRVSNKFYEFLNFVEDVSIEVEGIVDDGGEISRGGLNFFKSLNDKYFNKVWIEPASIISIETVKGLSADKVINQRKKYLPFAAKKIEESLDELKLNCKRLNLSLSEKNLDKAYEKSCNSIGKPAGKLISDMWKIYAK